MNVQTNNISDAVKHIETLQPAQRKEVFHFIDFLLMRNENNQKAEQTEKPKKKRQAGTAKGKAFLMILMHRWKTFRIICNGYQ